MFERYTEKARRVIFFARYEACQFGSPLIETEHLLLGLLREDKALTRRFFLAGTDGTIRPEIEQHTTIREKVSTSADLPLSNESQRVLAYSWEEAERLSHKHIGTEHLLLGLLREEKCFAAQLLNDRGVRLETAREELARKAEGVQTVEPPREAIASARSRANLVPVEPLHPLVGRADELDRILHILGCYNAKNPVVVGEPGVGKRTIVGGLAQRIADGAVPPSLADASVVELDLPPWGAIGSAWYENFHAALPKAAEEGVILFVDELHISPDGVFWRSAAHLQEILRREVVSGHLQCVSVATPAGYAKSIAEHGWLEGCFQPIRVGPASDDEALSVLRGIKHIYEEFHAVRYTDEALSDAVAYVSACVRDRYLPGKAVDVMDEAGSVVRMRNSRLPEEVIEVQKRIRFIGKRMQSAIANHEFEKARFYSDEERKERENLREVGKKYKMDDTAVVQEVTREDIEGVVARWTGATVEAIRKSRAANRDGSQ
jgi:ATP-dependent Clp protease ATP-binding subunit ClpC